MVEHRFPSECGIWGPRVTEHYSRIDLLQCCVSLRKTGYLQYYELMLALQATMRIIKTGHRKQKEEALRLLRKIIA